jgi:hypothetical protein
LQFACLSPNYKIQPNISKSDTTRLARICTTLQKKIETFSMEQVVFMVGRRANIEAQRYPASFTLGLKQFASLTRLMGGDEGSQRLGQARWR